jgi:hypothetical protein
LKEIRKDTKQTIRADVDSLIKLGFGLRLASLAFEQAKNSKNEAVKLLSDSASLKLLETRLESLKEAVSTIICIPENKRIPLQIPFILVWQVFR